MAASTGLGRRPSREMTAEAALELISALERAGIELWLDGGWAVDAVLGEQTRPHDDLDLVVPIEQVDALLRVLSEHGLSVGAGAPPESIELVDCAGRQVDVHPVELAANGDGLYRMENGRTWIYPARGFTGAGHILGRRVPALTPEIQVLCHTGYPPHLGSYDDVHALSRAFGVDVPAEYRLPRSAYRPR
jgi:lincosamide nucleotidyltransferase A/C/D/E